MPCLDLQQSGDRTGKPLQVVPQGQECGCAILAAQAELQRFEPGKRVGAVPVGVSLLLAPLRHLCLGKVQSGRGPLVGSIQTFFALFLHSNRGFQTGELALGLRRSCPALFDGLLEPTDLGLPSLDPAGPCAHLAGQLCQTLTAICGGTKETGQAGGLGGIGDLDLAAGGDRRVERRLGLRGLCYQRLLLLTEDGGLRAQLFGIAGTVVRDVVLILRKQPDPFGGQRPGGHETLTQRGEGKPSLLGESHQRRRLERLELERGQSRANGGQGILNLGTTGDQGGLVSHLLHEGAGQLDQVVGKHPKSSVACVGLDRGRSARSLSLATERPELAADLTREVVDPGEVDLHRLHLAQRPFLALAMLQDTGSLLDEAASFLGSGTQDGIELPLADDDMHLVADAGVGEQLLDVQQPAGRAIDGVLGAAVAKHRPSDRDLGVVDRERAIGVVDRQRHLGPPKGSSTGGAGENDVLHLAATQGLGTLLAHHPGEGVNDVRLACTVRADDAGDSGLELQRGCRRKRLEAPQGQALDVHVRWAPLARR